MRRLASLPCVCVAPFSDRPRRHVNRIGGCLMQRPPNLSLGFSGLMRYVRGASLNEAARGYGCAYEREWQAGSPLLGLMLFAQGCKAYEDAIGFSKPKSLDMRLKRLQKRWLAYPSQFSFQGSEVIQCVQAVLI